MELKDYEIIGSIHESRRSVVHRARRRSDGLEVVVKTPSPQVSATEYIARFRNEQVLCAMVDSPSVVRVLELSENAGQIALVTQSYPGFTSLNERGREGPLGVRESLQVALRILDGLAAIHAKHVVHKDLKPDNVLIDPELSRAVLIDFGIAAVVPRNINSLTANTQLEGTIGYMAPEQTGRINRRVDYRSDYYSLGATLHWMLAGEHPFAEITEHGALIHAHIARVPSLLSDLHPHVPVVLARIVAKLLSKAADDRYRGTFGLRADLQRCLDDLDEHGQIPEFEIGALDPAEHLRLGRQLYGRESQLAQLKGALAGDGAEGPQLVVVAGPSGSGKSALIASFQESAVESGVSYASGKFDQFSQGMPYAAISQALRALLQGFVDGPSSERAHVLERVREALGPNGGLLIELVPEIVTLLGPQPNVPPTGPGETRDRFLDTLARFAGALLIPEREFLLFIDDLQWADPPSLRLIQSLCLESATRLTLVLATRDDELGESHPFTQMLGELEARGFSHQYITLPPLSAAQIEELLDDTLDGAPQSAALAKLIYRRTQGTPLYVSQLLLALYNEGIIDIDREVGRWRVDLDRANARESSGDVVEFLAADLHGLDERAQQVLGVAACIGSSFDLGTLAALCDEPLTNITKVVIDGVASGHLLPMDSGRGTNTGGSGTSTSGGSRAYAFAHDRIQQIASGASLGDRAQLQLQVARRFLGRDDHSDRLHEIAGHIDAAMDLVTDEDERVRFGNLCKTAGASAKASTAYEAAAKHYANALGLLEEGPADGARFDLTLELGECQFMAGAREAAADTFARAHSLTRSRLERLQLLMSQGVLAMIPGDVERTLELLMEAAGEYELDLRRGADQDWLLGMMGQVLGELGARGHEEVAALPMMADPEQIMLSYELLGSSSAAYFAGDMNLYGGIALNLARIALEHGLCEASGIGFIQVGLLTSAGGQYELARRLSTIGFAILDRFPDSTLRFVGELMYSPAAQTYLEPIHTALPTLEAAHVGLRNGGMISMGGYAAILVPMIGLASGLAIHSLTEAAITARDYLLGVGDRALGRSGSSYGLVAEVLGDPAGEASALQVPKAHAEEAQNPTAEFAIHAAMSIALIMLREPERAQEMIQAIEPYRLAGTGMYLSAVFDALTVVNDCDRWASMDEPQREALRERVPEFLVLMGRWEASCSQNARALHHLVRGAWAHTQGEHQAACDAYTAAADAAAADGHPHFEGLANERAAELLLEQGAQRHAIGYFEHALAAYARWGARACERRVRAQLRQLIHISNATSERTRTGGSTELGHDLDVTSIVKMSQAMSESTRFETVAGQLLAHASENAGADRSVLMLERGGALELHAELRAGDEGVRVFTPPIALADAGDLLPLPAVRAATRSNTAIVVDDVVHDARCRLDAYALAEGLRSLCVAPIIKHGQRVGLLYLENRLTPGAFSLEQLEVLALLSSQAAITLDNARLFDALRESEEQWRSLVDSAPDTIMIIDRAHHVEFVNDRNVDTRAVLGATLEQLIDVDDRVRVAAAIDYVFETGGYTAYDATMVTPEGRRNVTTRVGPIKLDGVVERVTLITTDVTDRRVLEEQLRHAQKMQAVGTLAGGVAHDFNNLLTIILGGCELAELELASTHPAQALIEEISGAGKRAADLTGQLLAFSRKQVLKPQLIDLRARIEKTAKMLTRLIGEDIRFELQTASEPCLVRVDPGQIEQVLMNLAVNARDAMADGGTLTIDVTTAGSEDKPLVLLEVGDTGAGMSPELLQRVFEPFYTTKQNGKGTGLGLPTVLGIVEQSGGYLNVDSEPKRGTTVRVFLPRVIGEKLEHQLDGSAELPQGSETVLVVEDETAVRGLVCRLLELQGYAVLSAEGGEQALRLSGESPKIDLVLTDVVMPGANGREVAEAVLRGHPHAKVLYTSGYTDDAIMRHGVLDGTATFLQKPFTRESLAFEVRHLLDR